MNRLAIILAAAVLMLSADITPQERYIRTYSAIAVSEMERTGVPASITLAQGLVESGYGLSSLATRANNHFGVKCHKTWTGDRFYKDDDEANECFRAYPSVEQSFRDHSDFLRYQDRYKSLFDLKPTDYKGWAKGLKKAGYATDPSYASKLIKVIEDYQLYKFDVREEAAVDVPQSPVVIEKSSETVSRRAEQLRFPLTRPVMERNGVPCVYAMENDTYETLAARYGLFLREIVRFNDLESTAAPVPGEIVYLQAKKSKAAKGLDMHVVAAGESLRSIAQRFGVRKSAIVRMNKLADDYVPSEGDTIKLRRKP